MQQNYKVDVTVVQITKANTETPDEDTLQESALQDEITARSAHIEVYKYVVAAGITLAVLAGWLLDTVGFGLAGYALSFTAITILLHQLWQLLSSPDYAKQRFALKQKWLRLRGRQTYERQAWRLQKSSVPLSLEIDQHGTLLWQRLDEETTLLEDRILDTKQGASLPQHAPQPTGTLALNVHTNLNLTRDPNNPQKISLEIRDPKTGAQLTLAVPASQLTEQAHNPIATLQNSDAPLHHENLLRHILWILHTSGTPSPPQLRETLSNVNLPNTELATSTSRG